MLHTPTPLLPLLATPPVPLLDGAQNYLIRSDVTLDGYQPTESQRIQDLPDTDGVL